MLKKISKSLLFTVALSVFSQANAQTVKKIVIKGNKRIEKSTIQEYSSIDVGNNFNDEKNDEIIKNLYKTSLFDDISTNFNNGVLYIDVKETPLVSRIVFEGNYKIKTKILANEIFTSPGESLRRSKVRTDVEKIKEMYKRSGRFGAQVTPRIELMENNRAKVVFKIEEGPKTGIKEIYFVGNKNYKDSELKSIILTKESAWFRFLETNDTYDPDRIEYDKVLLKQFYSSVGFANFEVVSVNVDLLQTKEGFIITYSIDEGQRYNFGEIKIDNKLSNIDTAEIEKKFLPKYEGKRFNAEVMNKAAEKIADYLAEKGYPQVEVYPVMQNNDVSKTVDVSINIDHAEKVFINEINIEGNLKTEDHVIRRQFKIAEGDVFNRTKIQNGERNIRNLDYFDNNLGINITPTDKNDRYNINVDVKEKSTSSISLDLGYNTAGGPFGRISFLERNLVGTGQYLNAGVQVGRKNIHYYAGLTNPYFLGKDLSLGWNFFRVENGKGSGFAGGEQNYSSKSTGGRVSLGYDIKDDLFHEIDYSLKTDNLKSPNQNSSIYIKEQIGNFVTSSIGHSLTYDQIDNRVLPKNGYILTGSQEFAGVGGDVKHLKHEIDGKFFKSFVDNKYTIKFTAMGGMIKGVGGKKVRIMDRFNLGDYSLRGFESGGVGPRDKFTGEGLGGQKYYSLSAELNFPVGLPSEFNVTGAVFFDAGSLWDVDSKSLTSAGIHNDKSLRTSAGFGIIWITRIAPIRIDYAFPLRKKKYDEKRNIHIKLSTSL